PAEAQWTIGIQPLQETLVGNVRPMLLVLLGAAILIVFIVSLNIANLLLARASARQQEMAVRLSLGASRGRMVWQMLTESPRESPPRWVLWISYCASCHRTFPGSTKYESTGWCWRSLC